MPESEGRIERLEREMRRLRSWILVLGIVLATTFILGATQGTPDELTLRKLIIVDDDGKERIVAGRTGGGGVGLTHYDRDGKVRIAAVTFPTGEANLSHYDGDGQMRIAAMTNANGEAAVYQLDRNGTVRISAQTLPDGSAMLGINDGKEQPVWFQVSPK